MAANRLERGADDPLRETMLYKRGPLVLRMLHGMLGDAAFGQTLSEFLERAEQGPVDVAAFREVAERRSGEDLGWFFEQWLGQAGLPRLRVEHRVEPLDGGGYAVRGVVEQRDAGRFKIVHVPLVIELHDGRRLERIVVHDRPQTRFRFDVDRLPSRVLVDPARRALARYD